MTARPPAAERPRNLRTEALHKRETFWQVYFPMAMAFLLAVAVCTLAAASAWGAGGAVGRVWADVSLIFLILQVMVAALPPLVVLIALVVGVEYALRKSPPYFKIGQDYSALMARKVARGMRYVTGPVLQIKSTVAALNHAVQSAGRFFTGR